MRVSVSCCAHVSQTRWSWHTSLALSLALVREMPACYDGTNNAIKYPDSILNRKGFAIKNRYESHVVDVEFDWLLRTATEQQMCIPQVSGRDLVMFVLTYCQL